MNLILASKSPRRRELLSMLGVPFTILSPETDEDCDRDAFSPDELVMGLACRKARAVRDALPLNAEISDDPLILSADTVVSFDGKILEKPKDTDDAYNMLSMLSGNRHEVFTGISMIYQNRLTVDVQRTAVYFRVLSDDDIHAYIATNEPFDKAGAYGIQGRGALLVEHIEGDYFNVVGFPIVRIDELMRDTYGFGLRELSQKGT